jgi:hypothetical protein
VICAIADLALLIGHSLRSHRIDFIEVSQAASDMARSGESFHYFGFMGDAEAKPQPRANRCPACGRFVKASDSVCGRCGSGLAAAPQQAPAARAEEKLRCPSCQQASPPADRCGSCGFVLTQLCGRCQHRNPADKNACAQCGGRLAGRDRLASRQFEEGLRRIGVEAIAPAVSKRFPALQDEGRVYMGWVAPRFFWGKTSRLQTRDKVLEGSAFVTERSLVFANGAEARRIRYQDIRNLSINIGEGQRGVAFPRMRIVLADEELRLAFPVRTDRPLQLVSLLSDFVTNKKLPLAP